METHVEYRSQTLRRFQLEFVSASPIAGPVELGDSREILELDGQRYAIHREDKLTISSTQIRRIRWIETPDGPSLTIRIDGNARAALVARSDRRLDYHDALFVDGTLVMVPRYSAVLVEWLALHDPDRAALRRLYDRLVAD